MTPTSIATIASIAATLDDATAVTLDLSHELIQTVKEIGFWPEMVDEEPHQINPLVDALLAALAEYLCVEANEDPPTWTSHESRYLNPGQDWVESPEHHDDLSRSVTPISYAVRRTWINPYTLAIHYPNDDINHERLIHIKNAPNFELDGF